MTSHRLIFYTVLSGSIRQTKIIYFCLLIALGFVNIIKITVVIVSVLPCSFSPRFNLFRLFDFHFGETAGEAVGTFLHLNVERSFYTFYTGCSTNLSS